MNKEQWQRYTYEIINGNTEKSRHVSKSNDFIGNYIDERSNELTDLFNELSNACDKPGQEKMIESLIHNVAGDEVIILSIGKMINNFNSSPVHLNKAILVCIQEYIDKIISRKNGTLNDFKNNREI